MQKVKLTREQADALEELLEYNAKIDILREKIRSSEEDNIYADNNKNIVFKHLNDEQLLKALYIGYEVKPKFKVGDWVVNRSSGEVDKVVDVEYETGMIYVSGWAIKVKESLLRHATDEEIAKEKRIEWWAKHDREEYEFRKNDVVKYDCSEWGGIYIVTSDPYKCNAYDEKCVRVYNRYQRKTSISVPVKDLRIICFAEDRKDIE